MKLRLYVLAMTVLAVMSVVVEDASARFVDYSAPSKFIEVDVHALGGGSSVTQNYRGCFPQIQNLNVNMGYSLGVGARAVFGFRNYLGFGTELDLLLNNYNIDMAVLGSDNMSMSAVFGQSVLLCEYPGVHEFPVQCGKECALECGCGYVLRLRYRRHAETAYISRRYQ